MGATVLLDMRDLAECLRLASNSQIRELVGLLESGTCAYLADCIGGDTADSLRDDLETSEAELDDAEGRISLLETENDELKDRVAELEEAPEDTILLAWDLSKIPDPTKSANSADALALFAQMIQRASIVAPTQEPLAARQQARKGRKARAR